MSWGAVAVGVGTAVAGYAGKKSADKAAEKAAGAQGDASGAQIEESQRQFDAIQKLLAPYVEAGSGAAATAGGGFDEQEYLRQNPDVAADPYYATRAEEHFERHGKKEGRTFTALAPTAAKTGSLEVQRDLMGLNGPEAQQRAIESVRGSPQFTSMLSQGENSLRQNASATGGLRGGNTAGALAEFSPRLLSSLLTQRFQDLGSLTAIGQNAAAGVGNAGMQSSAQVQQALGEQGAAGAGLALARGANQQQFYSTLGNVAGMAAGKVF